MLSDVAIRSAKPDRERTIKLSDGGGLQLWVTPAGSKLWRVAYRFEGKQKKLSLGTYPAIGLKAAREERDEAKRHLAAGVDPSQQKRTDRHRKANADAHTFGVIADELLAKKRREERTEATLEKAEWLIGFARPRLGKRPIADITAPEILEVLQQVEARGKHETARRLRSTIGEVFRLAVATGRASVDPTHALRGAITTPKTKHRAALTEPKAFGALLRAIAGHEGSREVRIALELLALTFVRPGELRAATWPELDIERAVWSIPAERMKMKRPHRVPLASQTIARLEELRRMTGGGTYLFPSVRSAIRPISEGTLGAALRRLGYSSDEHTPHGFRASASSMLNEAGRWNADAIEAQLAHVDGDDVRRAYARGRFWDERIAMMQAWADQVDAMRNGEGVEPNRSGTRNA